MWPTQGNVNALLTIVTSVSDHEEVRQAAEQLSEKHGDV